MGVGWAMIDPTVSVGNLLQMIVIVVGGLSVFFALRADVRVMRHDMNNLKERQESLSEAFKQLGDILRQVAVQDERLVEQSRRIGAVEKTIDELRHGKGFISPMTS
jgi:hypothetical protein